jgi:phage tail protein X
LVPVIVIAVIVSVALPEFLRVTDFTALVTPVATSPKFRLVGVRVTAGLLLELNVAVTALAAVMVTLHVPVPEQAPLQPAKVDPADAVAVRVTTVPLVKLALQVLGQVMPAGLLLTFPLPVPASVTVRAKVDALNVAVTAFAAVMVTLQVPVPEQAPLQPAKVDPAAAVAVKVTIVPLVKLALQVLGQVMPAGLLLTLPLPVPASVTVSANVTALNVAVTALAAVMVTLQVPVPEQAPLQPAKVDPADAVAVRVTTVPLAKLALQVLGQVMPAGLLLTEPAPVPASVTDSPNEPDGTLRKTVSSAKSERTQFASAEPQAVRLKVTDVMLAPVWSSMPT